MAPTDNHIPPRSNDRGARGLKILLSGAALMLVGTALAMHPELQNSGSNGIDNTGGRQLIALLPTVAGALLTFLGGIRVSLAASPAPVLVVSTILFVFANAVPFATSNWFPQIREFGGTGASMIASGTCRIVALICLSTALVRLFLKSNGKV